MNNETSLLIAALSTLSGSLISLAFTYFPKIKNWYDPKKKNEKKQWMLVVLLISSVIIWFVGCYNLVPGFVALTCDDRGFASLILAVFLTISSNQSFYAIWPQPGDEEIGEEESEP